MEAQEKSLPKISMPAIWFRVILFLFVMWTWYISFVCQPKTDLHLLFSVLIPFVGLLLPDTQTAPKSWKAKFLEPVSWRFVVCIFLGIGILLFGIILTTSCFSKAQLVKYIPWTQGFLGGLLLWATVSMIRRTRNFQNTPNNTLESEEEKVSR